MAKRFELDMFGLSVIMRHDYEDQEISKGINSYRTKSIKALTDFLTNVPGSDKFETFLDVGCGDDHDVQLFKSMNPGYENYYGIDLYADGIFYVNKDVYIWKEDWYSLESTFQPINVIYMNHSLEHAANVYKTMQNISSIQKKGDVLFISRLYQTRAGALTKRPGLSSPRLP